MRSVFVDVFDEIFDEIYTDNPHKESTSNTIAQHSKYYSSLCLT